MADNYLEKRYDELFNTPRTKVKHVGHPIEELLRRNRSFRGYNKSFVVSEDLLQRIVSVCTRIPSARNQQVLRYRLVTKGAESEAVLNHIHLGAALPELHLPLQGSEPEAFIVICSTVAENRMVDIDLGIAVQSILLRAVEMGLGGLVIGAFNADAVEEALHLSLHPILIVAIGKPVEQIELVPIREGDSHKYYRKNGVHYVPKLVVDDLILKH